jgi:integrase
VPRTRNDPKLNTRGARSKLRPRREPYWRSVHALRGLSVGYRKGAKGGTWIAQFFSVDAGRKYRSLGAADDVLDADATKVLSYAQAEGKARDWLKLLRSPEGQRRDKPYAVEDALNDYLAFYRRRGGKAVREAEIRIEAFIKPKLGRVPVADLTMKRIRDWLTALAEAPARLRAKRMADKLNTRPLDTKDPEAVRRRRATANRTLTVLKAALNHAFREHTVESDDAWRRVRPFGNVDNPRIRFLSLEECTRLLNACSTHFRPLVRAALLTGCRYGELCAARARDFNPDAGALHVPETKSGKPRHVFLTDEGREFFSLLAANRSGDEHLFIRDDGKPWGRTWQVRPLAAACSAAKITPAISFHDLRHTYGSHLAMKGVPLQVIAQALGHADTRITERHYAHLLPSYVADTIRAHLPSFGGASESTNVTRLKAP